MPMLPRKNFIELNFCMGPMVWRPNPLFQHLTTMSLISKIGFQMSLTVLKNLIQGQKKAKGSQFSHLHYCNVCRGAHFSICKTKVLLRNQAIQSRDTYIERWLNS